jgi:hypothetical protein
MPRWSGASVRRRGRDCGQVKVSRRFERALRRPRARGAAQRTSRAAGASILQASHTRLVLDKKARFERDQRRKGGHGGAEQWQRTR